METHADTDLHIQANVCERQRSHRHRIFSSLKFGIAWGLSLAPGSERLEEDFDSNQVAVAAVIVGPSDQACDFFYLFIESESRDYLATSKSWLTTKNPRRICPECPQNGQRVVWMYYENTAAGVLRNTSPGLSQKCLRVGWRLRWACRFF